MRLLLHHYDATIASEQRPLGYSDTLLSPRRMITDLCDTLESVKAHKNVTLSLPEALLRRFRIYAASRNRSMTALMAEAIRSLMDQEEQAAAAKRRFLQRIRSAPDRGTRGVIRWTRDDLHER